MTVVGDGMLRSELERQMAGLNVRFLGRVPPADVARVMGASDALVLPSRSEGWPCVINESYAVGTPVVASAVGGVPEAVIDHRHIVPEGPEFERRFAELVETVIATSDPSNLIGHAAGHTWEAVVTRELATLGLDQ